MKKIKGGIAFLSEKLYFFRLRRAKKQENNHKYHIQLVFFVKKIAPEGGGRKFLGSIFF